MTPNRQLPDREAASGLAATMRQVLTGLAARQEQTDINPQAAQALVDFIVNALALDLVPNSTCT